MSNEKKFQTFIQKSFASVNGEIISADKAAVSVFDRGFLYGDSIYEVTYSENNCLLFFEEHLDRLYHSASLLEIEIFLEREEIVKQALAVLKHSKIERAYIRIILTRGETEIGLDPTLSFKNNLIILVKPQPEYPREMYTAGLKLLISSVLRNHKKSIDPNAKSGNYLNNVMAIKEAKSQGFDDAIMINKDDKVTEGTTFNIWAIKNSKIYTPPLKSGLLKGITRQKLLKICEENNKEVILEEFEQNFLLNADEVFITSSTKGLMPVKQMNGKTYGESIEDWPITNELTKLYRSEIKRQFEIGKYRYL